jgi:glycosyltransferase involved in cell wall biosynthesis
LVGFSVFPYLLKHGNEYDLINAHNYHAMPIFWSSIASARRLVVSPHYHGKGHTGLANWIHPLYRPFGSWAIRRAQQVICASKFEKDLVCKHLRVSDNKIVIIPDGINLSALQSAKPLDIKPHALLFVGRLVEYKRVDLAISALYYLPEDFKLFIIGNGPQEDLLRNQAAKLNIDTRVEFLKNISDDMLYRWYQSSQILVMMSEAESFPMTAIEALAAGVKVVCQACEPFTELADQFPEAVFPLRDISPLSLANHLKYISSLPGRVNVDLKNYDWNFVSLNTLKIFEKVCMNRPDVTSTHIQ